LPALYRSEEEMTALRAGWLRGLQETEVALTAGRFNPAGVTLTHTNFMLHYQGQNDREAQGIYGRVVTRIAEIQTAGRALTLPRAQPDPAPEARPGFAAAAFTGFKPGRVGNSDHGIATGPAAAGLTDTAALRPAGRRKIRVGFVSAFFNLHTVFKLFQGWITHLDRGAFETHVFHFNDQRDKATDFLAQHATTLTAGAAALPAAARAVAGAGLDVLIYPDIGMDAMTQMLAALRLAPVQCQAWGHPVTSGLPAIDYFLSSDLMEPEDAQAHYHERLVRLPGLSIRYPEPDPAAAVRPPGLPDGDGAVLFVCLQSLYKLLPLQDRLTARIAARVERSRLVFIRHASAALTAAYRIRLEAAFRAAGVNPEGRLLFLPPLKYGEFLGLARAADVILDSAGWSGGNTTLEALSFARPVVTLPGGLMRGRHTAAILRQIGVTGTVAGSPDDYVNLAGRLAEEAGWRNEIGEQMRRQKHLAYNDDAAIRGLEEFIRGVVTA
jgi:predicted O-linked N-acetylglucosamine transferase (SPINDLY family)